MFIPRYFTSGGRSASWIAISITLLVIIAFLGLLLSVRSTPRGNDESLRLEARKASSQAKWADAESALKRLADPLPEDWLLRAIVATSLDDPDHAADYVGKIPPDGPLAAQVALVTSRVELGRFRARPMEAALLRALKLDPKLSEARRSLVYLYGTQGRRLELLEQFAALAEQGPLTFPLVDHWCIAHQEQIKEPDDLKKALEKFVANDPDDRYSRLGLARVFRELGQFDRAIACLAPLPDSDADARASRAEVEFDRGNMEEVTKLVTGGPENHPRLARIRGHLALNRHEGAEAVRQFRLSDAAEPNHSETLYGLAQALRLVGDKPTAEPIARRAEAQRVLRDHLTNLSSNKDPKPVLCCRLAADCEASGYLPEARAWYRLAITFDPLYTQAQEALFRLTTPGKREL